MAAELPGNIESQIRTSKVEDYEIYLTTSDVLELHLRRGRLELTNEAQYSGFSIRVLDGGLGMASSTITSKVGVETCLKDAIRSARKSERIHYSFPIHSQTPQVEILHEKLADQPEEELNKFATKLIEKASSSKVELAFAKVKAFNVETTITNSQNLHLRKRETYFCTEVSFKADGERPSECWIMRYTRRPKDIPDETIEAWARLAKAGPRARGPKTQRVEAIFPPNVMCDLLVPVLSFHASAESLKQGTSKLKEGEEVAAQALTILDDGLYPMALSTSPFDDEGNPQRSTTLIEKGVFRQRIYDQMYGLSYGHRSTGNGVRQLILKYLIADKFTVPPSCQSTNIRVMAGGSELDELVGEIHRGIIVYGFSWLNPDPVSGSFGAEIRNGFLIEGGEITTPLKGGVVSGNVFDLMGRLSGLGNRAEITSGQTAFSCIAPYMRFSDVQVSGA